MAELPLVFVSGLLGSSHCVGMCGGFAVSLGLGAGRFRAALGRQLVYSAGRLTTYAFAGTIVGFAGRRVVQQWSFSVGWLQAGLSIVAGLFLVWQGLKAAGIRLPWTRGAVGGPTAPCLAGGILKTFLTAPGWTAVFLAGLMTGFLPCGLVYAFLALAGATGTMGGGAATMIAFGLGTIPLMVATGLGGAMLSAAWRTRLLRAAAWCVIVTGALSIARGAMSLPLESDATPSCPFCTKPERSGR